MPEALAGCRWTPTFLPLAACRRESRRRRPRLSSWPVRDENRRCAAAEGDERSRTLSGTLGDRAAAVRDAVVPDWLAEVVRPRPAPVPWPEMIRAVLAICVP